MFNRRNECTRPDTVFLLDGLFADTPGIPTASSGHSKPPVVEPNFAKGTDGPSLPLAISIP